MTSRFFDLSSRYSDPSAQHLADLIREAGEKQCDEIQIPLIAQSERGSVTLHREGGVPVHHDFSFAELEGLDRLVRQLSTETPGRRLDGVFYVRRGNGKRIKVTRQRTPAANGTRLVLTLSDVKCCCSTGEAFMLAAGVLLLVSVAAFLGEREQRRRRRHTLSYQTRQAFDRGVRYARSLPERVR